MMLQLDPPIPVETPKGEGQAVVLIDYGPDYDLLWVVFDKVSGECWTFNNSKVRAVRNITMNQRVSPPVTRLPGGANADEKAGWNERATANVDGNGSANGNGNGNALTAAALAARSRLT
jgi:hypothetical protein